MLEKLQTKQCFKCKKILPLLEFSVRRSGRDVGRPQPQCKPCNLAILQQWRDAHPNFKRKPRTDYNREYARKRFGNVDLPPILPYVKRIHDIRNQVFGCYTALEFVGTTPQGISRWLYRCACGAEHVVRKDQLRPNRTHCPTCQWEKP